MRANVTAPLATCGGRSFATAWMGLEHIKMLLQARGDNLGPVPRKAPPQRFRRGKLRAAICSALREGGPLTGLEIVARIAAVHGLP